MTTIANGFCVSEPMPVEIAAGKSPNIAIIAVITTGRTRDATPSRIAILRGCLCNRFCLKTEIKITPFWIQMPNNAMKPIPAEIEKFVLVAINAKMPPMMAKGTFIKTKVASIAEPKMMKRIIKMPIKDIGTT